MRVSQNERKKLSRKIVRKILDDLLERKGFQQVWYGYGQKVKEEIRHRLIKMVDLELTYDPDLEKV